MPKNAVHYVRCPRLWHLIAVNTHAPAPAEDPAGRMLCGWPHVHWHAVGQLALATRTYHCIVGDGELGAQVWEAVRTRRLQRVAALVAREVAVGAADFDEAIAKASKRRFSGTLDGCAQRSTTRSVGGADHERQRSPAPSGAAWQYYRSRPMAVPSPGCRLQLAGGS